MSANPNFKGNQPCRALIDTRCQCSIISEERYNEFKAKGLDSLELPMQNVVLKIAFKGRTKRIKWKALVKLQINNVSLDQIILISPQLVTPLLLGMDFCMDNLVVIPIHQDHWSLTILDMQSRTIKYYNSLGVPNHECMEVGEVLFYFYLTLISD